MQQNNNSSNDQNDQQQAPTQQQQNLNQQQQQQQQDQQNQQQQQQQQENNINNNNINNDNDNNNNNNQELNEIIQFQQFQQFVQQQINQMQQENLIQNNNEESEGEEGEGDSGFEDISEEEQEQEENGSNTQQLSNLNQSSNQNQEESKEEFLGCKHYLRKCKIQAPCCKKWYGCRLCHDEQYTGFKEQCLVERMDRTQISTIECLMCHEIQPASNKCTKCDKEFAKYYCDKCHLWQNKNVSIYHCDQCKMCRVGEQSQNFHCNRCDMCWPKISQNTHKCVQNVENQSCPVCMDNIKHSTQGVITLSNCGHAIHQNCLNQYVKKSRKNKCPLCNRALSDMGKEEIEKFDASIQNMTKDLSHFPKEFLDESDIPSINVNRINNYQNDLSLSQQFQADLSSNNLSQKADTNRKLISKKSSTQNEQDIQNQTYIEKKQSVQQDQSKYYKNENEYLNRSNRSFNDFPSPTISQSKKKLKPNLFFNASAMQSVRQKNNINDILEKKKREKALQSAKTKIKNQVIMKIKFFNALKSNQAVQHSFPISIAIKVYQFIEKIKQHAPGKNAKFLKKEFKNTIQDLSFFKLLKQNNSNINNNQFNYYQSKKSKAKSLKLKYKKINKTLLKIKEFSKKIIIFDPNNKFKKLWDIFYLFVIYTSIIILPIEAAMGQVNYFREAFGVFWDWYLLFVILIFLLDILVTLNSGIYEKGIRKLTLRYNRNDTTYY
ncbi:hypothetical protein PPERSA_11528 [Pseudocohnilembus persalinus]|uniref:RING-type domain-containing protein n=1 Tax=Pseudocohnilembus persalinus TaxID=266149 RepID=A0A0V0QWW7_PSEPJ|nr:hypothetical protein PPERSA_11528 [Pseudocohnilembus persalinus]|eukprot:KRX06883.1 hypothetical protein PPERSA_11528 [Pseudocohnilembus persalinus]